jgi:hypothetical protein
MKIFLEAWELIPKSPAWVTWWTLHMCSVDHVTWRAVRVVVCRSFKNTIFPPKLLLFFCLASSHQAVHESWSIRSIIPMFNTVLQSANKNKPKIVGPITTKFWICWWFLIIFINAQSGAKIVFSLFCQKVKKTILAPDWVLIKIIKNHPKFRTLV